MDFEEFKRQILDIAGIDLHSYKERQMKRRIDFFLTRYNVENYHSFVQLIKSDDDVLKQFIDYITINVSEFYRNPAHWEILQDDILPDMLSDGRIPTIWSAACSSGEEPYSLVIALNKYLPLHKICVDATDIDTAVLAKAQSGIYSAQSLKNLSSELINRYFDQHGNSFAIHSDVKACVRFSRHDLLKDPFPQEYYDLILCRNVMIYFTEEAKASLYRKFHDALSNNGILFVGGTEQIILPHKFGFISYKPFFYKKMA